MSAKVLSLDAARARRPCRRADGSVPGAVSRPPPDAQLAKALAAVAALGPAAFERKAAVFRRVWDERPRLESVDSVGRRSPA